MPLVLGQHVDRSYFELDHRFTVLQEPTHPSARKLIALWRAGEAKDGLRMGRDIPSRAVAPFLSQMIIYEPIGNWEDAYLRYAGFGTAKYFGGDVTGLRCSDVEAHDRGTTLKQLFADARTIVAQNSCRVLNHRALSEGIEVGRHEIVRFPIFGHDGKSRWLLNAAFDL
jgi:hypothetical protein